MRRLIPDHFILFLLLILVLSSFAPISGNAAFHFGWLTKAAIALMFFLHGARLSRNAIYEAVRNWQPQMLILAITFGLFPMLGLLGIHLVPVQLPTEIVTGIVFLCLLPSTVQSSIAFTAMAGGNVAAAVCAATASNVLGVFITPLLVAVFLSVDGGFSMDGWQKILTQLLLPFIIGHLVEPLIGEQVRTHKKQLGLLDRGVILMSVYLAFSVAVIEGLWSRLAVSDLAVLLIINIVILAVVLIGSVGLSRLLGFSRQDEIVIVFCGSKKSLVTGVPMASIIFAQHSVGAVVLPIMLFHQIQLMACAVIARRYAAQHKQAVTTAKRQSHNK